MTRAAPSRDLVAIVVAAFVAAGPPALAGNIDRVPTSGGIVLLVSGTLDSQDGERFESIANEISPVGVMLSGPGGSLIAGLQIGRYVRAHEIPTRVPIGGFCVSACAIAWLGGVPRITEIGAQVGFHAAFTMEAGRAVESGVANALAGAYFSRLGLSDAAIAFVTEAHPDDIAWLTEVTAREVGIDAMFNQGPADSTRLVAPAPPLPPAAQDKPPVAPAMPVTNAPIRGNSPTTVQLRSIREPVALPRVVVLPAGQPPLQAAATAFVSDYYAHWSEDNASALSFFGQTYAGSVSFYGTTLSRAEILLQKKRFTDRWPFRLYTVSNQTVTVTCASQNMVCQASGQVQWDVRSIERHARSIGAANFSLSLLRSAHGFVIEAESGAVLSRKEIPL